MTLKCLSRGQWLLSSLIVLCVATTPVHAHDLGLAKAWLEQVKTEEAPWRYQWRVLTSGAYVISAPRLPNQCEYSLQSDNTSSVLKTQNKITYHFTCKQLLTGHDEIILSWQRSALLLTATGFSDEAIQALFLRENDQIVIRLSELSVQSVDQWKSLERYGLLGMEHMLSGYDHLLFVLAILLLVLSPTTLIKTITAFTVGHSVTLALASFNVVKISSAPIETCIALSIVVLAYEVIQMNKGNGGLTVRYPWIVAGAFGLLHGLGFAGALSLLSVPPSELMVALLAFNVGVELGQLFFIGILISATVLSTKIIGQYPMRQLRVVLPYGIGGLALFWTLDRWVAMACN
ncbi:hypothetical protein A9Q99_13110 [Gammaproteobacteria bacterium 45_16_T64]|nr:hypothetical protein A9Q99_13110 [Gammaproteobacteria bacterium 45_16_T64]